MTVSTKAQGPFTDLGIEIMHLFLKEGVLWRLPIFDYSPP